MLRDKHLSHYRKTGAYVPGRDRIIFSSKNGPDSFDVVNDHPPVSGLLGYIPREKVEPDEYDGYFAVSGFKRINQLPKGWFVKQKGLMYEQTKMYAQDKGLIGEKSYFTLTNSGEIAPCDFSVECRNTFGKTIKVFGCDIDQDIAHNTRIWASVALQFIADSRFCWMIRAEECRAKVTIGCMEEEVKSLLYARTLPLSETGRKRPVLHLVESHKRRLRNGVDIDIISFLRGTQKVEINGTVFTVFPPQAIKPQLSKNSQKYFANED